MFRFSLLGFILLMAGCDSHRVYEKNHDFKDAMWSSADTLTFEITVPDSSLHYNVLLNVRNTIDFETVRLFVQYQLSDSTSVLRKRLVEQNLFDRVTGKPFGDSGLGNIYSHQFTLESSITFPAPGLYRVKLNHMMRYDTLPEIRSIGVRIEKTPK